MSTIYDNWERLVAATLDREKLRELALAPSRETSFSSSIGDRSDFSQSFSFNFELGVGDETGFAVGAANPLAYQVIKAADEAAIFKQECAKLKYKAKRLAALLSQAARTRGDMYDRPARRIIKDTEQVLGRVLVLLQKCRGHGLVRRVFTLIPATAFRKMSAHLDNSIGDVSWLLRISGSADDRSDDEMLSLPPIVANNPTLCLIWEQISVLSTGSPDDRSSAAESLVSLAGDKDRYRKLIIEEGGVGPLLNLIKKGTVEGKGNAARAIGLLGRDPESVKHMVHDGVCQVFVDVLREGPMKVQAVVAWAVSELASHYPECQDLFARHNIIWLLVGHLAFETVVEHSKYAITGKASTNNIKATTVAADQKLPEIGNDLDDEKKRLLHNVVATAMEVKGSSNGMKADINKMNNIAREMEDPSTKTNMKAMAARALCHLAKGNSPICRSITKLRALLCFAVLLEKGSPEAQYNSAMALMEITTVAEGDFELRRSAFKPNSPAFKAVVDQLFLVIEKADSELLVLCIKAIGNLSATFKASETRMIGPLVRLLDEREAEVTKEACIALTKFASLYNFHCLDRSKAIIEAGGAKHLVQLVYVGENPVVQRCALILLCYITMNVPESAVLAQAEVLASLEWASGQAALIQEEEVQDLLPKALSKVKFVQDTIRAVEQINSMSTQFTKLTITF